jgi:L-fuculose-phosphate aldolase
MQLQTERAKVRDLGQELLKKGLTTGTGGNISVRGDSDTVAVSPSAVPYEEVETEDVVVVDLQGEILEGDAAASSETPMHTMIYRRIERVGGVVHTHSPYASTFASLGEPIPPSSYLVAIIGEEIPVVGYEEPGSEALGELAAEGLEQPANACLLQNHGVIAVGETVEGAFEAALITEHCARIHYQAMSIGDPIVMDDESIAPLVSTFEEYRNQN